MSIEIIIDLEKCKGCELCVNACPKNVLEISDKSNSMGYFPSQIKNPENCTGCGNCYTVCPDVCIEIRKD